MSFKGPVGLNEQFVIKFPTGYLHYLNNKLIISHEQLTLFYVSKFKYNPINNANEVLLIPVISLENQEYIQSNPKVNISGNVMVVGDLEQYIMFKSNYQPWDRYPLLTGIDYDMYYDDGLVLLENVEIGSSLGVGIKVIPVSGFYNCTSDGRFNVVQGNGIIEGNNNVVYTRLDDCINGVNYSYCENGKGCGGCNGNCGEGSDCVLIGNGENGGGEYQCESRVSSYNNPWFIVGIVSGVVMIVVLVVVLVMRMG